MNRLSRRSTVLLTSLFWVASAIGQTTDDHQHGQSTHQDQATKVESERSASEKPLVDKHSNIDSQSVYLEPEQLTMANIKVEPLFAQVMDSVLYSPAELKANGYTSYLVSPRIDSVVMKRHVSLGQHVQKGQPLVTLFSESIAQAQAQYRIDFAEWNRVRALDKSTVSEKQTSESQTRYIASLANLKAFGLAASAIEQIGADNDSALGEYTLEAQQGGSVLDDDFQQGQRVEAGQALMTLTDETELWVEARLSPNATLSLPAGTLARLSIDNASYVAKVIQEAHTIDPQTRTRVVRLSVENPSHALHPGMFGEVFFSFKTDTPVLAVPEAALMRSNDGDWIIFVEHDPGEFQSVEVVVGRSFGQFREISGVAPGRKVVTEGAFFVASEQAKGGFDPHNH